ncbi:MAG: DUF3820 family protein [Nonlabens sp.]|nr:DUF3820 family protein [Nonlabens sp.]
MESPLFDPRKLVELAWYKMPFGKYKDRFLSDLPEFYVVWFKQKGFPEGKLGQHMEAVYDMKLNGIEDMLREIRKQYPKPVK